MADRRYKNGKWQGNPVPQSTALLEQERRLYASQPTAWGWEMDYYNGDYGLQVYKMGIAKLMEHPHKIGCWIVDIDSKQYIYSPKGPGVVCLQSLTADVRTQLEKRQEAIKALPKLSKGTIAYAEARLTEAETKGEQAQKGLEAALKNQGHRPMAEFGRRYR